MITADKKIVSLMAFMAGVIAGMLVASRLRAATESPVAFEPFTSDSNDGPSLKVQTLQALLVATVTASATYLLLVSYYGEKSGLLPPHANVVAATIRVYSHFSAYVKIMRRDNMFPAKEEALSEIPRKRPITKNTCKRVQQKVDTGFVHVKRPRSSC